MNYEQEGQKQYDKSKIKNLCTICKCDMGYGNPRQYCGKTFCPMMFEEDFKKDDEKKDTKKK